MRTYKTYLVGTTVEMCGCSLQPDERWIGAVKAALERSNGIISPTSHEYVSMENLVKAQDLPDFEKKVIIAFDRDIPLIKNLVTLLVQTDKEVILDLLFVPESGFPETSKAGLMTSCKMVNFEIDKLLDEPVGMLTIEFGRCSTNHGVQLFAETVEKERLVEVQ